MYIYFAVFLVPHYTILGWVGKGRGGGEGGVGGGVMDAEHKHTTPYGNPLPDLHVETSRYVGSHDTQTLWDTVQHK
jgi:hypothetical protein